ncbi:hypothetical protein FDH02_gp12 [Pseudomonas phage VSW-3]|uniref:Uncharacterized protein n=1 Tax=Pseudomonas phage VSW-3 TaxID=1852562 RepID=A0A173GD67_9CAUD|nr:hypothetical protein FDH02_gp12 [Pseudomonas phage VSW-3]ANH51088.1 hypothetical protein VSW3_12 [Pseudomonas phage VSW-3]
MKHKVNPVYRKLSNAITAAEDTGNAAALLKLEQDVHAGMMLGELNIHDAAALQADIDTARDAIGSVDTNTDYVRHVAQEREVGDL